MSEPLTSKEALGDAIVALEAQRAVLGDALVHAALGRLRKPLAASPAAQRRRQVSVLFLDIVGSTALSQTLDPKVWTISSTRASTVPIDRVGATRGSRVLGGRHIQNSRFLAAAQTHVYFIGDFGATGAPSSLPNSR